MPARRPLAERIWEKVWKTDACWLWTASTNGYGYAQIRDGGGVLRVHRWTYQQAKGPIPDGMHLDHLCRVRHCVNPAHLEAVTLRENTLRGQAPTVLIHKTGQCIRGHALIRHDYPSGVRWHCSECHARRSNEGYYRRRSVA